MNEKVVWLDVTVNDVDGVELGDNGEEFNAKVGSQDLPDASALLAVQLRQLVAQVEEGVGVELFDEDATVIVDKTPRNGHEPVAVLGRQSGVHLASNVKLPNIFGLLNL